MSQPRIRRDYRALSPAERQRFFYCVKMLAILPPQQSDIKRTFYIQYQSKQQKYRNSIEAQNIHDQLIASHQTACQHRTPYFPYYHRHLTMCAEIAINYAQEVLLSQRIPERGCTAHQKQWTAVFKKYSEIIDAFRKEKGLNSNEPLPQLAMHYWNPTDYTKSIVIPQQLRQRKPDQIDSLYFAINQHYPWNFNFKTRWLNNKDFPKDYQEGAQYFNGSDINQNFPTEYNEKQKNMLNGTFNPRNKPKQFLEQIAYQAKTIRSTFFITMLNVQFARYKQDYQQLKTAFPVCGLEQAELNVIDGSKQSKLHWIAKSQVPEILLPLANVYNKLVPHYQYAYALLKNKSPFMPNYVTTNYHQNYEESMQNVHNNGHNNLGLFMCDVQLSITNLLFFLYHSWIDLVLETKIRMIRNSPSKNSDQLRKTKNYLDQKKGFYSVLDQISGGTPRNFITWGDYYVYQWVTPHIRTTQGIKLSPNVNCQVAFKGRDFVLNGNIGIRRSDELNALYHNQYLKDHGSRYSYFKGLSKFIFDYNYEIYQKLQNGQEVLSLMQGNHVPIPKHIQDIADNYNWEWNQNPSRKLRLAPAPIKQKMAVSSITQEEEIEQRRVGSSMNQSAKIELLPPPRPVLSQQQIEAIQDRKYILRAIRVLLAGYGKYDSTIESTIAPIGVKLTKKGIEQLDLEKQYSELLEKGFQLPSFHFLQKASLRKYVQTANLRKKFGFVFLNIWLKSMLNFIEVIYQIKDDNVVPIRQNKICELLQLESHQPIFNTLRLLEGAVEVNFKVNFYGHQDYEESQIKINGFSYSVQTDQLFNIVSKKREGFRGELQLAQVIGINEKSTRNRYLYRLIKVFIKNGNQTRQFEFEIHTYHDLIRYEIDIYEREGVNGKYLDVTVRDRDFKLKDYHFGCSA